MKKKFNENFIADNKNFILNNQSKLLEEKEVMNKYGKMFHPNNLANLTRDDFKSFLLFKNNKHWDGIHRQGNIITKDMGKLRKALKILLDENKDIKKRLDFLFPEDEPSYIKGLGRAIVTPLLLMVYPDKYGVWNRKSRDGLKRIELFPKFKSKDSFSYQYIKINQILNNLAQNNGVTLWQLDWILGWLSSDNIPSDVPSYQEEIIEKMPGEYEESERFNNFGLEKHLEDFLIENWDKLRISKKYSILEEGGDIIGQQYFTKVGVIDILARSKDGKEWLVIELKKGRTSDRVVGQILKYIGWISEEVAKPNETVKGIIIAGEIDDKLKYALKTTKDIKSMVYSVSFSLSEGL